MEPGALALDAHLRSGRFLAGVAKGRWRLQELAWPVASILVFARDGRGFVVRLQCDGYPQTAPTGTLWDPSTGAQLSRALWPRGGRVSQMFNPDWKTGTIYVPCDRVSREGHDNWAAEHPALNWDPARGILQYIEACWETLQSNELAAA